MHGERTYSNGRYHRIELSWSLARSHILGLPNSIRYQDISKAHAARRCETRILVDLAAHIQIDPGEASASLSGEHSRFGSVLDDSNISTAEIIKQSSCCLNGEQDRFMQDGFHRVQSLKLALKYISTYLSTDSPHPATGANGRVRYTENGSYSGCSERSMYLDGQWRFHIYSIGLASQ